MWYLREYLEVHGFNKWMYFILVVKDADLKMEGGKSSQPGAMEKIDGYQSTKLYEPGNQTKY